MKGTIGKTLALVALFGLLGAAPGYSLAIRKVNLEVPFDFNAGNVTLPAGHYSVERNGQTLLVVRDANRAVKATLSSIPAGYGEEALEANVTFVKYGDAYFLSSVEAPGGFARDVQLTRAERDAADRLEAERHYTVTVDVDR